MPPSPPPLVRDDDASGRATIAAPERRALRWAGVGALLAGLAVAAGAFGAHGLEGAVTEARLATFETAARYQMLHGLGLLLIGALAGPAPRALRAAPWLLAGSVVFSGSLYALVLLDVPVLGAVAPVGGVLMIGGWGFLAWSLLRPG